MVPEKVYELVPEKFIFYKRHLGYLIGFAGLQVLYLFVDNKLITRIEKQVDTLVPAHSDVGCSRYIHCLSTC